MLLSRMEGSEVDSVSMMPALILRGSAEVWAVSLASAMRE